MSDPHIACETHRPVIHLSGETHELKSPAAIDDAVIEIIMELNEASADAKDELQKQKAEEARG